MENLYLLFPGSLKPFHDGHFTVLKSYLDAGKEKYDLSGLRILYSEKERSGLTADSSEPVLEKVKDWAEDKYGIEVTLDRVEGSPIRKCTSLILDGTLDTDDTFAMVASGKLKNMERVDKFYDSFNGGKYDGQGNVVKLDVDVTPLMYEGRSDEYDGLPVSGSVVRMDADNKDFENFKTAFTTMTGLDVLTEDDVRDYYDVITEIVEPSSEDGEKLADLLDSGKDGETKYSQTGDKPTPSINENIKDFKMINTKDRRRPAMVRPSRLTERRTFNRRGRKMNEMMSFDDEDTSQGFGGLQPVNLPGSLKPYKEAIVNAISVLWGSGSSGADFTGLVRAVGDYALAVKEYGRGDELTIDAADSVIMSARMPEDKVMDVLVVLAGALEGPGKRMAPPHITFESRRRARGNRLMESRRNRIRRKLAEGCDPNKKLNDGVEPDFDGCDTSTGNQSVDECGIKECGMNEVMSFDDDVDTSKGSMSVEEIEACINGGRPVQRPVYESRLTRNRRKRCCGNGGRPVRPGRRMNEMMSFDDEDPSNDLRPLRSLPDKVNDFVNGASRQRDLELQRDKWRVSPRFSSTSSTKAVTLPSNLKPYSDAIIDAVATISDTMNIDDKGATEIISSVADFVSFVLSTGGKMDDAYYNAMDSVLDVVSGLCPSQECQNVAKDTLDTLKDRVIGVNSTVNESRRRGPIRRPLRESLRKQKDPKKQIALDKAVDSIKSIIGDTDVKDKKVAKKALTKLRNEKKKLAKIDADAKITDVPGVKKFLKAMEKEGHDIAGLNEAFLMKVYNAKKRMSFCLHEDVCIEGRKLNECGIPELKGFIARAQRKLKSLNKDRLNENVSAKVIREKAEQMKSLIALLEEEITYRKEIAKKYNKLNEEDNTDPANAPADGGLNGDITGADPNAAPADDTKPEGDNDGDGEDEDKEVELTSITFKMASRKDAEEFIKDCVDAGVPEEAFEIKGDEKDDEGEDSDKVEEKYKMPSYLRRLFEDEDNTDAPEGDDANADGTDDTGAEDDKPAEDDKKDDEKSDDSDGAVEVVLVDTDYTEDVVNVMKDVYGFTDEEIEDQLGGAIVSGDDEGDGEGSEDAKPETGDDDDDNLDQIDPAEIFGDFGQMADDMSAEDDKK